MDRMLESSPRDNTQLITALTEQVVAAELHLTHFAVRHGKESPIYQDSLKDFATAWFLLRKHRDANDFHPEIQSA